MLSHIGLQTSGLLKRSLHNDGQIPILIHDGGSFNDQNKRLYIQKLHLHPLNIRFSFGGINENNSINNESSSSISTSAASSSNASSNASSNMSFSATRTTRRGIGDRESLLSRWKESSSFMTGIFTLVDVDTDLKLGRFQHNDVFTQRERLVSMISQHYVSELTSSFVSILNLIGGTLSKGVASLAMDDEYLRDRQTARRTERISHVGNGLWYGTKRLGVGIFQGVSGVFTQPVKGAMKDGMSGFGKGLVKGVVGVAVKPVVGVTDFLSSTTAGASATTTTLSEYQKEGRIKRKGLAWRTRTPRLMYGATKLLKVYNDDEAYVRAIILAVRGSGGSSSSKDRYNNSSSSNNNSNNNNSNSNSKNSKTRMTKDNVAFNAQEFKVAEYITHVRIDTDRICIITSAWVTLWNTCKYIKLYENKAQKSGGGKKITLLFAIRMSAVGMVATSEDGRNVLISLGVSKNASVFVMEIGNAEMAATVLQRLTHISAGRRNF